MVGVVWCREVVEFVVKSERVVFFLLMRVYEVVVDCYIILNPAAGEV